MRTGGAELDAFGVGNEKECAPGKVLVGAGEVALGAGKEKVGVEVVGGLATGAAPKLKEENAPLPLAGAAEDDTGVGRAPKGLDDTATGPKLPPPRAANGFLAGSTGAGAGAADLRAGMPRILRPARTSGAATAIAPCSAPSSSSSSLSQFRSVSCCSAPRLDILNQFQTQYAAESGTGGESWARRGDGRSPRGI